MHPVESLTKYLRTIDPDLTGLVGLDTDMGPWIFQDKLMAQPSLEGTGKAALVVKQRGSWAPPNQHNTARFPLMIVEIWVDPSRSAEGLELSVTAAKHRGEDIFKVLFNYLHKTNPGGSPGLYKWDSQMVLNSYNIGEPEWRTEKDGTGLVRGETGFAVSLA